MEMPRQLSGRQKVVLAALASSPGASFAPVQVQKMFFLIDENLSSEFSGKLFNFTPYDYGPFDKAVYCELDRLAGMSLASISQMNSGPGSRRYSLTPEGQALGEKCLAELPQIATDFISEVSTWVRGLSFAELVGSIYQAFPHMRERSIFVE